MPNDELPSESARDPAVVGKQVAQRPKELPASKAATLPKAFKASKAPRARLDAAHNPVDVMSLDRAQRKAECTNRATSLSAARTQRARAAPAEQSRPQQKLQLQSQQQKVQPQQQNRRTMADASERLKNGTSDKPLAMVKPGLVAKPRPKTAELAPTSSLRTKTTRSAKTRPDCGKVVKAEATEVDGGLSREPISLQEMGAHLKRLTEEHARLQTEYARVRTLLQDANVKSSSRIASPVPLEQQAPATPVAVDGEAATCRSAEADRGSSEDGGEDTGDGATKEGFRKEVLRLREELLAAQQQLTTVTEAKIASDQELAQLVLRTEETGHELFSRDGLIEQLSRQMLQLKARANMQKAEHMQKMEEKEEEAEALARRLKEAENESRETKEFMQEENNSLSDALGETEERAARYQLELGRVQYELEVKEKHCQVLSQVLDQKQVQLQQSQAELTDTQDGAKEMLLKQGVELNGCATAVRRIHRMAEGITKRILSDAEALGVEVGHDEAYRKRRSSDGRKLVWAILQAASKGQKAEKEGDDGAALEDRTHKVEGVNGSAILTEDGQDGFTLETQTKEVESAIRTLGRIQKTVNHFLFTLLNDAEVEKTKLEKDFICERKRLDEMQSELQENVKRRWALEEKNKELQKELSESKENLKDSHDTLKSMWDKIDEKANWLIENKKLKEEIDSLKKQNDQLDAKINLLSGELQETIANYEAAKQGNAELSIGEYAKKQVSLKEEISSLHRLLVNREEEMHEKCQKHERHQQVVKNNLLKAEEEVRRLDTMLDHVFIVLKSTPELQEHPVLKKLWDDLDGESIADAVEV